MKRRIKIGIMKTGVLNNICDINGITVGHRTIDNDINKTGLTAILPHQGNLFRFKVQAGCFVLNGFGKSIGLVQLEELGSIETPIILTNTLNVGKVADGLVSYMLENNPEIGTTSGTINPLVCECNDGSLNNIRIRPLGEEDVYHAINNATVDFEEGSVGAGKSMICHGLKGGIGSASRVFNIGGVEYKLGVLVNSNFGRSDSSELIIAGKEVGKDISKTRNIAGSENKGSIIVVVATDMELDARQLTRLSKRAAIGIGKTGSSVGNGSGDIIIAFSTANKVEHFSNTHISTYKFINDDHLNLAFKAVIEATEEAILNSLLNNKTTFGVKGNKCLALVEFTDLFKEFI